MVGYQVAVLVFGALALYALLSWASAPAAVLTEQSRRQSAEATVVALKTSITFVRPSPTVRRP